MVCGSASSRALCSQGGVCRPSPWTATGLCPQNTCGVTCTSEKRDFKFCFDLNSLMWPWLPRRTVGCKVAGTGLGTQRCCGAKSHSRSLFLTCSTRTQAGVCPESPEAPLQPRPHSQFRLKRLKVAKARRLCPWGLQLCPKMTPEASGRALHSWAEGASPLFPSFCPRVSGRFGRDSCFLSSRGSRPWPTSQGRNPEGGRAARGAGGTGRCPLAPWCDEGVGVDARRQAASWLKLGPKPKLCSAAWSGALTLSEPPSPHL